MEARLTPDEVEHLLTRGRVGRIGCHAEGRTYVVPVAYAYDGECVYARSHDGLKIRTMRTNESVCFEMEEVDDEGHWRSVIAWGTYEELGGAAEERAAALLRTTLPPPSEAEPPRLIFYRLRLGEKTGHLERWQRGA